MKEKCRIADAMNTYDYALRIIKSKGYKIFLYPDHRKEYLGDFWAIKGDREFIGEDPLRLLGVITLWENTGDEWQTSDFTEEYLYDEIISRALPDTIDHFKEMSDDKFRALVNDYRVFFKNVLEEELPEEPSKQEMFEIIVSLLEE